MPFMAQQAKADDMVIALAIEVLVTQDAFLLETEGLMELDGALVIRQRLAIDFVQFELGKGMAERCAAKLPSAAFGGIGCCVKTPVSNAATSCLVEVHEPHGLMVSLENQQVFFGVWQAAFKPALMFS